MTKPEKILVHVTSFDFQEYLLTTVGRDGKLPSFVKCILLGIALYIAGIVSTFIAGTLFPQEGLVSFIQDTSPLVVSIVVGVTLAALIRVLSNVEIIITQLRRTCDPIKEKELFESFVQKEGRQPRNFFLRPDFWYYLETFGGAIVGGALGYYWAMHPGPWWGTLDKGLATYYYIAWCTIIGYITGAAVYVTVGTMQVLMRYCKNCITDKNVLPANPDKVGGLRCLGHWSLQLDIVVAIPSFVIFDYLVAGASITNPASIGVITLYTIFLVIVFFVPLSAVHDAMLKAKEGAFRQIDTLVKRAYARVIESNRIPSKDLRSLRNIYFLYKKVEAMAVWPLNFSIFSRFFVTSLFPVIGSLIISYVKFLIGQTY